MISIEDFDNKDNTAFYRLKPYKSNWDDFKKKYNIVDESYYLAETRLHILKLGPYSQNFNCSSRNYPQFFFPYKLVNETQKVFGDQPLSKYGTDSTSLHLPEIDLNPFIQAAKTLGYSEKYIEPDLIEPTYPSKEYVQETHTVKKEVINKEVAKILFWVSLILYIPSLIYFLSEGIELGIIITLLYLPLFFMICKEGGGLKQEIYAEERYSEEELEKIRKENNDRFNEKVKKYYSDLKEYKFNCSIAAELNKKRSEFLNQHMSDVIAKMYCQAIIADKNFFPINDTPQRGYSENILFAELMKLYPDYVRIDCQVDDYFPDIIITVKGKCIDIEIDEKYEFNTKKEIHYVGIDDYRNETFINWNWFVLRFAEEQIIYHLKECVLVVSKFIKFLETGDIQSLNNLLMIMKEIQIPQWTKEQARLAAINNERSAF